MKIHNLGTLEGPVLLFGGPYSNLDALRALMAEASAKNIAPTHMICTGDVVAYCGDPSRTVERMREAGIPTIAGNCEKQLAAGAQDCGCGFEEGTACDLLSAGWFAYANTHIVPAQRKWMGSLPDLLSFSHGGIRYGVIHGGLTNIARFIWPTTPDAVFAEEWQAVEAAIGPVGGIIAGHCGVSFVKPTAKGMWINAGVIGMPPHDGTPQTRFAILDGGEVTIHRLSYDVNGAISAMTQAGLTQGYNRALKSGYWPSEDVLPPDLRVSALARG